MVGQSAATKAIVPYVYMYQSGLAPEGRPAGVFLLLGPTGTGKTKTVGAIAELLHGDEKKILKIDCGEFQMEHETAKLVGAPPGYLGHRETTPLLTQQQLTEVTSPQSELKRTIHRQLTQPLATLVACGEILPGAHVNKLGLEFQKHASLTHVILMTGGCFSAELQSIWEGRDLPILYKPFLAQDVINLIRGRIGKASAAAAVS